MDKKIAATMTKAEFAKLIDVSRPRVSQLIAEGMPCRKDGRINTETALTWHQKHIRVSARKLMDPKSSAETGADNKSRSSFIAARAQREQLAVKKAQLDLRQRKGELISAAEVEREVFNIFRAERDALLNWPSRISAEMAAEFGADETRAYAWLNRQVNAFLVERSLTTVEECKEKWPKTGEKTDAV